MVCKKEKEKLANIENRFGIEKFDRIFRVLFIIIVIAIWYWNYPVRCECIESVINFF